MKVIITIEAKLEDWEIEIFKSKTDADEQGQADLVKDILRNPTELGTINWIVKK